MFDYLQKFNKLPKEIREKISSSEVMAFLAELERRYQVDLAIIVMKVMVNILDVKSLTSYFISDLGLDQKSAENLNKELIEKIFSPVGEYLGIAKEIRALDLEADINLIIREVGLILPSSDLITRLKVIISTYLKGIRSKVSTRDALAKPVNLGGLSLSSEEIDRIFKVCEQKTFKNLNVKSAEFKQDTNPLSRLDKIIAGAEMGTEYNLKQAIALGQIKKPENIFKTNNLDTKHELATPEKELELEAPEKELELEAPEKELELSVSKKELKLELPKKELNLTAPLIAPVTPIKPVNTIVSDPVTTSPSVIKKTIPIPPAPLTQAKTINQSFPLNSIKPELATSTISPTPTILTKSSTQTPPISLANLNTQNVSAKSTPLTAPTKPLISKAVIDKTPKQSIFSKIKNLFNKQKIKVAEKTTITNKTVAPLVSTAASISGVKNIAPIITPTLVKSTTQLVTPTKPITQVNSIASIKPFASITQSNQANSINPVKPETQTNQTPKAKQLFKTLLVASVKPVSPVNQATQIKPIISAPIAPVKPVAPSPTTPIKPSTPIQTPLRPIAASRPTISPNSSKQTMHDIKVVPKVMGPIEELHFLDLLNFRRLGKTPEEITAKIFSKIKLLEVDGYDKMVAGVKAWRQSPVNHLYLKMMKEAINKNTTIKDFAVLKQGESKEYLSLSEIEAIILMNSKLIF